jgi:hypothetical protein
MLQRDQAKDARKVERRKHWRDRRATSDRRNSDRLQRTDYDCRSGIPRRQSDVAGELADGEVWWEQDTDR